MSTGKYISHRMDQRVSLGTMLSTITGEIITAKSLGERIDPPRRRNGKYVGIKTVAGLLLKYPYLHELDSKGLLNYSRLGEGKLFFKQGSLPWTTFIHYWDKLERTCLEVFWGD